MSAIVFCYLLCAVNSFSKGAIHLAETFATFSRLKAVTTGEKTIDNNFKETFQKVLVFFIGRIHLNEKNEKKSSPCSYHFATTFLALAIQISQRICNLLQQLERSTIPLKMIPFKRLATSQTRTTITKTFHYFHVVI